MTIEEEGYETEEVLSPRAERDIAPNLWARIEDLKAELTASRKREERLRAALKPFADRGSEFADLPDDFPVRMSLGEFRRSKTVMEEK